MIAINKYAAESTQKGNRRLGVLVTALAAACALSSAVLCPNVALASDATAASSWKKAVSASTKDGYSAYSYASGASTSGTAAAYPNSYDLRDKGVVTPVKNQGNWQTCWSFATIAAAETSILSDMGKTYAQTGLDLSERYLAWFAYSSATKSYAGKAQAGEGFTNTTDLPSYVFTNGGVPLFGTSMFSAGIGPVNESDAEYKNSDGYIVCNVLAPNAAEGAKPEEQTLTQEKITELRSQGYTVTPRYYATDNGDGFYNSDWSLKSSLYGKSSYTLEESFSLPDVPTFNKKGEYTGPSQAGVNAIKEQLTAGRGVAISYHSDGSTIEDQSNSEYMNFTTWSSCTDKKLWADHAVTIVGWDDNYSKENFLEGHQPEGNGAWLVKNSWGASTSDFPNNGEWGIVDEDGNNTGYFWLSYYDQTITGPTAFDFDVNADGTSTSYSIDQYNYMANVNTVVNSSTSKLKSANEFAAKQDRVVNAMTCETAKPNTTVTYQLYLLNSKNDKPTKGSTPVVTKKVTYKYGGYHRVILSTDEQVSMRKGQRYSIVVTQKCKDDGKWYQVVGSNYGTTAAGTNYKYRSGHSVAKVNSKESWTYQDGMWTDWSTVTSALAKKDPTTTIDNFPIKALYTETTLDVAPAGTNSVKVSWSKTKGAKSYKVRYSTKKSMANAKKLTTKKRSATLGGLDAGTTYYFQVKARTSKGWTKWSSKRKATTDYSITYRLNGGSTGDSTVTYSYTAKSAAFKLPTPTKEGCAFLGWYSNAKCTGSAITKVKKGSKGNLLLFAKWGPVGYWLAPANASDPTKSVVKTMPQIQADVQSIKTGDEGVIAEYKTYMTSENYHLYSYWNGSTVDAKGSSQEANRYVEFRIIAVGSHDGDGSALTFHATHMLPTAYAMGSDESVTNWGQTALRSSMQKGGGIYKLLDENLTSNIMTVEKKSQPSNAVGTTVTTQDSLWLLSYTEVSGDTASNSFGVEGVQYEYYADKAITSDAQGNESLARRTRAGNNSSGAERPCWWLRSSIVAEGWPNTYANVWDVNGRLGYSTSGQMKLSVAPAFCM